MHIGLIQLIRENPDFRATVRRELLTEELLEVPGRLQSLTTTVEGLAATVRAQQTDVSDLKSTVAELVETAKAQQKEISELRLTVAELSRTVKYLVETTAQLRGDVLGSSLTGKIPPLIAREFDVCRVYPIWSARSTPINPRVEEFQAAFEYATDEGKITDDDETRLRVTELIVRSQRRSDRSTLWFAIEASGAINANDITRARHSADVLKEIHDQDAIPVVYGYQISDRYRELAGDLQVPVFLDAE